MSAAAGTKRTPTVQQIITEDHKQLMQDVASFLAISLFVAAVLIWAY